MEIDTHLKNIHDMIISSSENDEIELRFGKFESNRFKSDCNIETFNRVNDFVKSFSTITWEGYQKILNFKNSKGSFQNKRGTCDIKSFEDSTQMSDFNYEIKKKLKTYDANDFDLRFCISQEKKVKKSQNAFEEVDFYIKRKRTVYQYQNIKIFMSYYVLNDSESDVKFNIEIEVDKNINYDVFSCFIKEFLKAYNGCVVLINNAYKKEVIEKYNKVFNFKKFKNILIQPQALKLNKIIKEKEYSVSLKLDGVRKMIILYNQQILTFNDEKLSVIYCIENNTEFENLEICVFDTEYYDNKYYIFDTLCYNGKDTRNFSLKQRISIYTALKFDFIEHKDHHFSNYKNLYNVSTKLLSESNRSRGLKIDGLIYTNTGEYTIPPLKFKFDHTIDFYILKKENNVELYCNDTEDYCLFTHPDYVNIGISNIEFFQVFSSNSIIECYFCKLTKKFKPLKYRFDKIKPNFISVALDNFEMTINPFKLQLFKEIDVYETKELSHLLHFDTMRFFHYVKRKVLSHASLKTKNIKNAIYFNQGNLQDIQKFIDFKFKSVNVITNDIENIDFKDKISKIKNNLITKNFEINLTHTDDIKNIKKDNYIVILFNKHLNYITDLKNILLDKSIVIIININWEYIKTSLPCYSGMNIQYDKETGMAVINKESFKETSSNIDGFELISQKTFNSFKESWCKHFKDNFLSNQGELLCNIYNFSIYKKQ
jgi:hypothetical protein